MDKKQLEIEIKKYSVNTRYFGYGTDENGEIEYEFWDEHQYNDEIESMEDYIDDIFPNGGRFVGQYQFSSYRGGKLRELEFNYTNEQLKKVLVSEGPRGAIPFFDNGTLHIPMEDLGGGIITSVKAEYKGEYRDDE